MSSKHENIDVTSTIAVGAVAPGGDFVLRTVGETVVVRATDGVEAGGTANAIERRAPADGEVRAGPLAQASLKRSP